MWYRTDEDHATNKVNVSLAARILGSMPHLLFPEFMLYLLLDVTRILGGGRNIVMRLAEDGIGLVPPLEPLGEGHKHVTETLSGGEVAGV